MSRRFAWFLTLATFAPLFLSGCGTGGAQSAKTKTKNPAPVLQAQAAPSAIDAGQSSTLSWSASDAEEVSIDSIGDVSLTGSRLVQPAQTTTYTLRASGSGGVASQSVTITVRSSVPPPPPSTPAIQINANPATINAGDFSQLTWSTTNARSVVIDNGIGSVQPPSGGSRQVSPAGTTTYTATATGENGATVSQSVTIVVNPMTPAPPPPSSSVSVPTWHMDNARTGLNSQETALTPASVKSGSFGKLFSYLVDGYLYAQPLYVSNLSIGGVKRNVVFAATEYDSVYAFDADHFGDGSPLWKNSLLQPGETPQPGGNPKPWIGITSTPAIDLNTQTMYVVSAQQGSGDPFFRLHALNIVTGAERTGSPVLIQATVKGSNSESVHGNISLTAACLQRTALLLNRGTLYFGFSACHSGWMLAYNAADLRQTGALNMSPNADGYGAFGGAGGVWMGGGGPIGDSNGFAYVTTGNGPYDGGAEWGESILKLDSSLSIVDHFTPSDWAFLQCKDLDLSGGGAMLIPSTGQIIAGGKGGKMYLVNSGSLGGTQANDAGAAQTLWFNNNHYQAQCTNPNTAAVYSTEIAGYQIFGTAAFFNGSAYLGVTAGPVQQFAYNAGRLTPGPSTDAEIGENTYGTTPFVSANGNQQGIMWMLDHDVPIQDSLNPTPAPAILRAYDAANISVKLYDSSDHPADQPGYGIKFTSPIVANGKVVIGTAHDRLSSATPRGELDVYGLK